MKKLKTILLLGVIANAALFAVFVFVGGKWYVSVSFYSSILFAIAYISELRNHTT